MADDMFPAFICAHSAHARWIYISDSFYPITSLSGEHLKALLCALIQEHEKRSTQRLEGDLFITHKGLTLL